MKKEEFYKKCGIDIDKVKEVKNINIDAELLNKLQNTATRFLPIALSVEFERLANNVNNGNYSDAYSSDAFKTIIDLCKKDNCTTLKRGSHLLRARIVNEDDLYTQSKGIEFKEGRLNGYDWINSKEPPIGMSPDGRASIKNSSYLYCSCDGNTAASEIKANVGDFISLATFKAKRNLKIIDFSEGNSFENDFKTKFYIERLVKRFSKPISDLNEYKLTQFISDEIRKCGVDGICYTSHFTQSHNYVIFNCSTSSICFEGSRILKLQSQQLFFTDYSNEKTLLTKTPTKMSDEEVLKEKIEIWDLIKLRENFDTKSEDENNG